MAATTNQGSQIRRVNVTVSREVFSAAPLQPLRALALLLVLMVTGCQPIQSLYPFFEPGEAVFEPRLLGQWASPQKAEFPDDWTLKLRFQESKDNAYALQLTSHNPRPTGNEFQEVSAAFRAHLFRVGELLFLDVELERGELKWEKQSFEAEPDDSIFMVATHSVFRVKLNGDRLQLAFLDNDAVEKLITQGKLKIPHRG